MQQSHDSAQPMCNPPGGHNQALAPVDARAYSPICASSSYVCKLNATVATLELACMVSAQISPPNTMVHDVTPIVFVDCDTTKPTSEMQTSWEPTIAAAVAFP